MVKWAVIFLVIALITGFLGFKRLQGTAMTVSKVLFFLFAALFVLFLILALFGSKCGY